MILTHGLGGRSDLPIPVWVALYVAVGILLFSFLALGLLWRSSRFGTEDGVVLPRWIQFVVGERASRLAQAVALVGTVVFLAVAWFGPPSVATNPAPTWLYVWVWVGLVPCSLLLGPVWRFLNPVRALARLLSRVVPSRVRRSGLPAGVGRWPAVVSLGVFVWLELVFDHSDEPRVVAGFVTAYVLVHGIGGAVAGPRWFDAADGLEVYSATIGRLAPWGRSAEGEAVLRHPLAGLAAMPVPPGQLAVLCTLLGSTAFDGVTRTSLWGDLTRDLVGPGYLIIGTLGLVAAIMLVAGAFQLAMRATDAFSRYADGTSQAFAHTMVPIIVGYTVAHYFSFAIFQGQLGAILASDPFGRGWDLFGSAQASIDYLVVSPRTIAVVQLAAVVGGHVAGVVAAHDRSLEELRPRSVAVGQLPYLLLMVGLTSTGLVLLMGL